MFVGIDMFSWAPFRIILAELLGQGWNEPWKGPKTYLWPRTKTVIFMEDVDIIKNDNVTLTQSKQYFRQHCKKMTGTLQCHLSLE